MAINTTMSEKKPEIDLTTDSIPKLLRQLCVPAFSVGLFFSVLYNVVDTYFGGQISPQTLASVVYYLFPVFFHSLLYLLP